MAFPHRAWPGLSSAGCLHGDAGHEPGYAGAGMVDGGRRTVAPTAWPAMGLWSTPYRGRPAGAGHVRQRQRGTKPPFTGRTGREGRKAERRRTDMRQAVTRSHELLSDTRDGDRLSSRLKQWPDAKAGVATAGHGVQSLRIRGWTGKGTDERNGECERHEQRIHLHSPCHGRRCAARRDTR